MKSKKNTFHDASLGWSAFGTLLKSNSYFSLFTLSFFILLTYSAEALGQKTIYVERDLKEVTVKPKKQRYKRKGNPAVELMRKVIDAKANHSLEQNDFVSYYKYQRVTTGFDNISQHKADSMKLLQHPLLKQQVEYCPQTDKYILPLHYVETATHHLWRREPKIERNYVLGTNSEGVTDLLPIGDEVNTVVQSLFTDINIYDDVIDFLSRRFTSPLSSRAAISFFQFFIEDTVEVDSKACIQVSFVPQNPQDFGFSGRLWILNDSTYRVHKGLLHLPLRSSVNYVNALTIEQRFTDLPNGQRVLQTDDLFAELGIIKGHRAAFVHRATNYTSISTDTIPDEAFRKSDKLREGTTNVEDPDFWARHRVDTLSKAEGRLSDVVNSFQQLRGAGFFLYVMRAVINNYFETSRYTNESKIDIGPVMSMYSNNFIDGPRVRLGFQTTAKLLPKLFFKGYAAYGFRSRNWYGMGEVEYSFLRKKEAPHEFPRHSITAQFRQDVFSPADMMWQHGRDKDNVWTSFKTQDVTHMMFQRHFLLRYEYETNNHLDFKFQAKHARITPCGDLFYRRLDGEMVEHLYTSDLMLSLRWAPGEQIINSKQRRHYVNRNNPVFTLSHTCGIKGILGSDYNYNVTELTAYKRIWLNSYGKISLNLRGAVQWNRVPFPLLLMPVANNSYIITRDMFCMINNMEFINDRYLSFQAEWDLSGKLFNRIPLLKKLKLREVIGFKALYGRLSAKNNPALHPGDHDLYEMPSRDGVPIVHEMGNVPYMELNVGIHNILKIIRIDYVYRINYHDFPGVKKHGVRFALEFDF